jgi:CSLREA domain-containing protein
MRKLGELAVAAGRASGLGGVVPATSVGDGGRASRLAKALVACCVLAVAAAALFPSAATGATVPVTVTIDSVTNINAGDVFDGPDFFTRINIANQSWFTSPVSSNTPSITPGWTTTKNVSSAVHRIPIRIEIYDDDTFLGIPASELIDVDPSVCPDGGLFGCAVLTIGRPAVDYRGLDLNLDLDTGAVTPVDASGDASAASTCTTGTETPMATVCFTITVGAPIAGETLVVTKTADTNDGSCTAADCSLREAIDRATPLDTISLPARSTPYQLTDITTAPGHLEIRKPVTIVGPSGGGTAIIEQTWSSVFRVFDVFSSGNLTLSNVTIRGGEAGDTSTALPGHIHGGGIHNHGTVTLTNVTITGNHARSSMSSSVGGGGGIYNAATGTLTMTNVTIAGNDASVLGGAISGPGAIHATNLLVVDNAGPSGNCSVAPTDDGGNLQFPDATCGPGFWTASVNPIGSLGAIAAGTYPLLPGSQAIDRGTNTGCPAADQLGFARPVDGNGDSIATCDPGAVEYDPTDVGVIHQPLDSTGQPGPVRLTFDDVLLAGFTTLLMPATGSAPPALYKHGTPARYYNLTTTALFSGQITVCIDYTGIAYVDEPSLRLFHHTAAGWSDETTSLDTSTNTICGKTAALSEFAVFEPLTDSTPPTITPAVTGTLGSNGWYTSDVGLTWTVSEPESPGTLVKTGCDDQSITADQPAASYSCSASSLGGTAGPVTVALKRDATAPTLSFSGNAGSYTVAQNVSIGCSASDNLSGIASGCAAVSAPAYTFPLGANTVTRSATDNAGNTGTGSTSFTVVVGSQSLCTLTSQFVQGSAKYQALSAAAKKNVDAAVSAACALLNNIGPTTLPAQKAKFIKAYKDTAQAFAKAGWLTQAQATKLSTLADAL